MKITKQQLTKIIKEELEAMVGEEGGEEATETAGKTVYVLGQTGEDYMPYGAEDAIDIKGIYDTRRAAEDAFKAHNEKRAKNNFSAVKYDIIEFKLNQPVQ